MVQSSGSRSWILDEPGWPEAKAALRRVETHARTKWVTVLLISLGISGFFVYRKLTAKSQFEANVMFRLTEKNIEGGEAGPSPKAELRDYIFNAVLTRPNALKLMENHNLFLRQRKLNLGWAMEELADRIDIAVFHNQFLLAFEDPTVPRSARVRIGYLGESPEEAIGVVREVARMVIEHESKFRGNSAQAKTKLIDESILSLRHQIDELKEEQSVAQLMAADLKTTPAQKGIARMKVGQINELLHSLTWRLQGEIERKKHVELQEQIEAKQMGLRMEVVDWGMQPPPAIRPSVSAAIVGTIIFVLALPIVGIVFGAYYQKILAPQNVHALGLTVLGHIKPYEGWNKYSLKYRLENKN